MAMYNVPGCIWFGEIGPKTLTFTPYNITVPCIKANHISNILDTEKYVGHFDNQTSEFRGSWSFVNENAQIIWKQNKMQKYMYICMILLYFMTIVYTCTCIIQLEIIHQKNKKRYMYIHCHDCTWFVAFVNFKLLS